jgi:molybdopterin biosynthesis enzyme MoaB
MSSTTLKAAILIISDTASQNPTSDATGNILKDVFDTDGRGQWEVVETKIVPDNIDQIQHAVTQWTDQLDVVVNLILTSGGTGFAVKDNTPEVRELLFLSSWPIECATNGNSFRLSFLYSTSRPQDLCESKWPFCSVCKDNKI